MKALADSGWLAPRPSGTAHICNIYAESVRGADHPRRILEEGQPMVNNTLAPTPDRGAET